MGSQKDLPAATRPRVLDVALADAAAAEGGAAGGPLGALEAAFRGFALGFAKVRRDGTRAAFFPATATTSSS